MRVRMRPSSRIRRCAANARGQDRAAFTSGISTARKSRARISAIAASPARASAGFRTSMATRTRWPPGPDRLRRNRQQRFTHALRDAHNAYDRAGPMTVLAYARKTSSWREPGGKRGSRCLAPPIPRHIAGRGGNHPVPGRFLREAACRTAITVFSPAAEPAKQSKICSGQDC